MSLVLIGLVVLTSIAASIITTRSMVGHCFNRIDRCFEETFAEIKKVSLDAMEEIKNR